MEWWLIVLTVVVGAGALGFAATADRRRTKRLAAESVAPPKRHIPTLDPDAAAPSYVSEESARTPAPGRSIPDLGSIADAVEGSTPSPGGWADDGFITHPDRRWAVALDPMVLACSGIGSFRELLGAVTAAKRAQRPLIVVAPAIEADTVRTLAANAIQGHLPCLAVLCADMPAVAELATRAGATVVTRDALQSGWLPASSYGRCAAWVSDARRSWVISTLDTEV